MHSPNNNPPRAIEASGGPVQRGRYLPTLDGWRAVAVTAVLVFHSGVGEGATSWWDVVPLGHLGVAIFFALSGFLICTLLLNNYRTEGRWGFKRFYVRRCFRILPAAWLFLGCVAGLRACGVELAGDSELWCCLGFIRNYLPRAGVGGYYTSHFWSLAVEEHFYLLFPVCLAALGPKKSLWAFPLVSLLTAGLRWAGPDLIESSGGRLPPGLFFWSRTHVRLDALLWGCWWAVLRFLHPNFVTSVLRREVVVGCVLVLAAGMALSSVPLTALSFCLPPVVIATAVHPQWHLSRLLEIGWLKWIGRISYAIYLWQQLFFVQKQSLLKPDLSPWQTFPYNVAAVLVLAVATHYLVERPMISLGYRVARTKPEPHERSDAS